MAKIQLLVEDIPTFLHKTDNWLKRNINTNFDKP